MKDKALSLLETVKNYPNKYWLLNLIQMTERLAYWTVLLQMPIYIAQKDVEGGLQWEHTEKGIIFFWWALVQNIIPVLTGGLADKYGRKRTMLFSYFIITAGYLILGSQREFSGFLAGALVLGAGLGILKPALQGLIAGSLEDKNTSVGWGIYVMLTNLAVFFGPPMAIFLKGISWQAVFYGGAAIFSINFLTVLFIKDIPDTEKDESENTGSLLTKTIVNLIRPEVGVFILLMSGFTMIYMQFYETLPNFIYDWSDTSQIVSALHLPDFMITQTARGTMIAYEWLYNLNAGMIILSVVFFSWILQKANLTKALTIGLLLATGGLLMSGYTNMGWFLILGIVIYTFGEIITNPRFNEYMGKIAPLKEKSLYMSYLNISWTIGLSGGGILGGWIYKHFGEKSYFAMRYLNDNFGIDGVSHSQAFEKLCQVSKMNHSEATSLLWNTYHPNLIWLPFVVIGLIAVIGMWFFSSKYDKIND